MPSRNRPIQAERRPTAPVTGEPLRACLDRLREGILADLSEEDALLVMMMSPPTRRHALALALTTGACAHFQGSFHLDDYHTLVKTRSFAISAIY